MLTFSHCSDLHGDEVSSQRSRDIYSHAFTACLIEFRDKVENSGAVTGCNTAIRVFKQRNKTVARGVPFQTSSIAIVLPVMKCDTVSLMRKKCTYAGKGCHWKYRIFLWRLNDSHGKTPPSGEGMSANRTFIHGQDQAVMDCTFIQTLRI